MSQLETPLGEVLESFMTSVDHPDRESLERYVANYPQYAEELAEFAAEWLLLDAQVTPPQQVVGVDEKVMARSVMERLRPALRKVQSGHEPLANPFEGRSPHELKTAATRIGLDTTLLAKLKNRLILFETIPKNLIEQLAEELGVLAEAVAQWLGAPPRLQAARFKAEDKPSATRQESFSEAVERSDLDPAQKRQWLGKSP